MAVTSENMQDVCKCTAWMGDYDVAVGGHTAIIRHWVSPLFLVYYFRSDIFNEQKVEYAHGSKVIEMSPLQMSSFFIPLPPLAEQERIVAEIQRLFSLIDLLDNEKKDIAELIKNTKSKILSLAIQGKLVEQNPGDEPASELLKRINPAWRPCDTSHYPYDIPKNWQWSKICDICKIKGGKRIPKGKTLSKATTAHIYLRVSDLKNHTVSKEDIQYIDDEVYNEIKNYTIKSTDLYITVAGSLGRVGVIPEEFDGANLTENADKLTDIKIDKSYLLYCLDSFFVQEQFNFSFHQVAQPKLSIETLSLTLIPLPPLNEQKRIVEKIEGLFKALDAIQAELTSQ